MSLENYTTVDRQHGSCLLRNDKPVWIVEYSETRTRPKRWQVYEPMHPVPKGRDPWTINNRRLGPEDGIATLEQAVAIGDAA